MRILLISLNRYRKPDPVFPLGMAYVADAAIRAGHNVRIVDMNTAGDDWLEDVRAFQPEVVGISIRNVDRVEIDSSDTLLSDLPGVVAQLRPFNPRAIVLGGSAVSLFPDRILDLGGADYAICGEGESAFVAFVSDLEAGREPSAPWLVKRGAAPCGASAPSGFELCHDESFRPTLAEFYLGSSGMLNIQTQRGCPLKCCYCTYPQIEGRRVRRKDPAQVVEEFQMLERIGAHYLFVVDAVFNTSRNYVASVCEALIAAGNKLRWCCFLRPADIDPEVAALMSRAGLTHAEFGSDSLSEPMLRAYGKHFRFDAIQRTSAALLGARVKVCHFIIFGGPGETETTVRETFALSDELPGSIFMHSCGLRVYPGTPLHGTLLSERPELAGEPMLDPFYYLSPLISREHLESVIAEESAHRSNWISSATATAFSAGAQRMRRKGVRGPLWDYMELAQRMRTVG